MNTYSYDVGRVILTLVLGLLGTCSLTYLAGLLRYRR